MLKHLLSNKKKQQNFISQLKHELDLLRNEVFQQRQIMKKVKMLNTVFYRLSRCEILYFFSADCGGNEDSDSSFYSGVFQIKSKCMNHNAGVRPSCCQIQQSAVWWMEERTKDVRCERNLLPQTSYMASLRISRTETGTIYLQPARGDCEIYDRHFLLTLICLIYLARNFVHSFI